MIDRIISGRYLIRAQIGAGGMAVVYKATDTQTGTRVALKVLRREYNSDLDFIRRFAREAEAASKMFHENIVNTLITARTAATVTSSWNMWRGRPSRK